MTFDQLFQRATGNSPFGYQRRLALEPWPELLDIPTGLGKTASVVLAWIYKRCILKSNDTPRRLVYCLPMRVLVEQTHRCVESYLRNLDILGQLGEGKVSVHLLMGGAVARDWAMYPEADVILIGTQDMLLSRALNRGYAAGRARWPVEFGLLNNDCLWVLDEVQLMGSGLATTAQLDAFQSKIWNPMVSCRFLWMSATLVHGALDTRDRQDLGCQVGKTLSVTVEEKHSPRIEPRLWAEKEVQITRDSKGRSKAPNPTDIIDNHVPGRITLLVANTVISARDWFSMLSEEIKRRFKDNCRNLKPELYLLHSRFRPYDRESKISSILEFIERRNSTTGTLDAHPGIVVVATQVIEAGFDISAVRLWSEIAPWPSIIQRLGRLNREGLQPESKAVFWMPQAYAKDENANESPNAKRIGPYEKADLDRAERLIDRLTELMLKERYRDALEIILSSDESSKSFQLEPEAVVRPDDLYGLFSTEHDLAGGYTDISHLVRDQDRNSDVQVFWRAFDLRLGPPMDEPPAMRDELASIPFFELRRFLGDKGCAWEWDFEKGRWERRRRNDIHPGMTLLLACSQGGYSDEHGWTGDQHQCPLSLAAQIDSDTFSSEALGLDTQSQVYSWCSISEHLADVEQSMREILAHLGLLDTPMADALLAATRWHDRGKSLCRWQKALWENVQQVTHKCELLLQDNISPILRKPIELFLKHIQCPEKNGALWAKWPDVRQLWQSRRLPPEFCTILKQRLTTPFSPGLRHEAASALAAWGEWIKGESDLSALAIYLIASHHGKVRTFLRSISNNDEVFGLQENDMLPPLTSHFDHEATLPLDIKRIGMSGLWLDDETFLPEQPSWTAMIAELLGTEHSDVPDSTIVIPRDEPHGLGPFKLAYLEALIRAADARASQRPKGGC